MPRAERRILLVLFALSGFSGLVYESIWTHYLKLVLGHAAGAQALVLSLFMGGMAGGAALASRRSHRLRDPLLAYAIVEALVGALALVFHEVFDATTGFAFDALLPRLDHPAAVEAVKWGISGLLILPQCVLLGATFPLMAAGVLRREPERQGRSVALLYFANSIGGVGGALLSGFYLVAAAGLPGTVRVAGVVNLAVGATIWLRHGRAAAAARSIAAPAAAGTAPPDPSARRDRAFLLGVALLTGASSFVYEIAWTRMLSLVLGASTRAFELMLASFILGLALGGLWSRRGIDALRSPVARLIGVQVAMGLLALATLLVYDRSFDAMQWVMSTVPRSSAGYALFTVASAGIAMAVMLPAAFCAGMTLPLITVSVLRRDGGEGSIGAVYAANTLGAIVAVLAAGYAGMPLLGVKGLLTLGAAVDLALGVALAWRLRAELASQRRPAALAAYSAMAVALAVALLTVDPLKAASGVYRHGTFLDRADQVVFHRDGRTATVSLISAPHRGQLRISTNGKVDAAISMTPGQIPQADEFTMVVAAALPMSLHPGARTAACIGFGSGLTTNTLLENPRLTHVDTIEIEEEMVVAARAFAPRNDLAYSDPRSHLTIDDAKSFFATSGTRYDLIVSEPSNPWVSGVGGLFTDEFYGRIRRHLTDGGLFVQWVQLYEIYPGLVASVLKGVERNFSDYAIYVPWENDAVIVARNGGAVGSPDPSIFELPRVAESLRRLSIRTVQDLDVRKIGDRRSWDGFSRSFRTPMNSDYDPVLDQNAERARFLRRNSSALAVFGRWPFPVVEMLSPAPRRSDWTAITFTPHFSPTVRVHEAMLVRDLVLEDSRKAAAELPERLRADATQLAAWLRACQSGEGAPMPFASFLRVARECAASLTPEELRAMWAPLTGACSGQLGPWERAWVAYVAALSDRDGAALARMSRMLLEEETLHPDDVRYLVTAALLGSIEQRDLAGARTLWARYASAVSIDNDLLLRVLVARAQAPQADALEVATR